MHCFRQDFDQAGVYSLIILHKPAKTKYVCADETSNSNKVMQLRWEKRSSTQEMMRHVPLEDGHACIPLVVEVFGGWGNEAINVLLAISKKVVTQLCRPLNEVMSGIYSRLSLTLMRQNARATLARCVSPNTCCDF